MIKQPYTTYFGGKSGDGTYQAIINNIPPHDVFMSLCAGNCAVSALIKPAQLNIISDINHNVIEGWRDANPDAPGNYLFVARDVFEWLNGFIEDPDLIGVDKHKRFLFLDPPYLLLTRRSPRKIYKFEFSESDHRRLLELITDGFLNRCFNVMICAYPNRLYDNALTGWRTFDYQNTTRMGTVRERLYMNYDLTELHDYSFLGVDFREREKFKRIKTNLIAKLERLPLQLRFKILEEIKTNFLSNEQKEDS